MGFSIRSNRAAERRLSLHGRHQPLVRRTTLYVTTRMRSKAYGRRGIFNKAAGSAFDS